MAHGIIAFLASQVIYEIRCKAPLDGRGHRVLDRRFNVYCLLMISRGIPFRWAIDKRVSHEIRIKICSRVKKEFKSIVGRHEKSTSSGRKTSEPATGTGTKAERSAETLPGVDPTIFVYQRMSIPSVRVVLVCRDVPGDNLLRLFWI